MSLVSVVSPICQWWSLPLYIFLRCEHCQLDRAHYNSSEALNVKWNKHHKVTYNNIIKIFWANQVESLGILTQCMIEVGDAIAWKNYFLYQWPKWQSVLKSGDGGGKGFNNMTTVFISSGGTILLWSCVPPSIYCNCLLNVFVPFFSNICIFMHASVNALAQIYELVQNIISSSKAATKYI